MVPFNDLPVAVIGAGPVGLAAAAHLLDRALPVKVYEAGAAVGNNVRDWGHVRVFTPWRYCVDVTASKFLERHGWHLPAAGTFPTGNDLVRDYLEPLAAIPEFTDVIETGARISAISRQGVDKVVSRYRETRPFILQVETIDGVRRDRARAVIDASGTWQTPNPLGADGLHRGGRGGFSLTEFFMASLTSMATPKYNAGMTTLVVGSGHSAINTVMDLVALGQVEPGTASIWTARSTDLIRIYGGSDADQLPARGELGAYVQN